MMEEGMSLSPSLPTSAAATESEFVAGGVQENRGRNDAKDRLDLDLTEAEAAAEAEAEAEGASAAPSASVETESAPTPLLPTRTMAAGPIPPPRQPSSSLSKATSGEGEKEEEKEEKGLMEEIGAAVGAAIAAVAEAGVDAAAAAVSAVGAAHVHAIANANAKDANYTAGTGAKKPKPTTDRSPQDTSLPSPSLSLSPPHPPLPNTGNGGNDSTKNTSASAKGYDIRGIPTHAFNRRQMEELVSRMENMNREVRDAERRGLAPPSSARAARIDRTGGESGDDLEDDDDDSDGGGGRGRCRGRGSSRHSEEDDDDDYSEHYDVCSDAGGEDGGAEPVAGSGIGSTIVGAARSWLVRRREMRRRAELARQVEEQRRKLQFEARMREKAKMTRRSDHSWVNDTGSSALEAKLQAMKGGTRLDRKIASEAAWGSSGVIAGICGVSSGEDNGYDDNDDDLDYGDDDVGENDGDGDGNKEGVAEGDGHGPGGDASAMRISDARQTLSGNGMTVALDFGNDDDDDDNDDGNNAVSRVVIVPEEPAREGDEISPYVLTDAQMRRIASKVLPPALMLCRWKRLYSLARDGDSFDAFLRLVADADRSLLVIRTTMGEVFGAYSGSPYEARHYGASASSYYGSAQACLWRIVQRRRDDVRGGGGTAAAAAGGGGGESANGSDRGWNVKVYKWTGLNRYIQLVDVRSKMIAFGGGGNAGEFGLCIEDDFRRGSTGPCGTFGNDPLCDYADGGSFEVVDVECWAFLSGFG